MLTLLRLALLVMLAFLAIGIVVAIGASETGPAEKIVLGIMLVAVLIAAVPIQRIRSARH